jgi:DNA invertase Pin-like site-specific DNA recombinase
LAFAAPAFAEELPINGSMAEFERSVISERTKAGMAAARRRGRHRARPA